MARGAGGAAPQGSDIKRGLSMSLTRFIYRGINRVFAMGGLTLVRTSSTFANRITGEAQLKRLYKALAAQPEKWLERQNLFAIKDHFSVEEAVELFYNKYLSSPFRTALGGSGFNNLLWLYLIARSAKPAVIIDSGTFTGASAW